MEEVICIFCETICQKSPTDRGWTRVRLGQGIHFDCAKKIVENGERISKIESPSPVEVDLLKVAQYAADNMPDHLTTANERLAHVGSFCSGYKKGYEDFRANHLGEDREGQDELWIEVFDIINGYELRRVLLNDLKKNYHLLKYLK